jgi:hypothetical protein
VRGVEPVAVSRSTWPERVGGGLAAVVHGRGGWFAWGLREVQREGHARWFGREGREKGWRPRWSALVSVQSRVVGRGVGCTPGADRWGRVASWVRVPTWRVEEGDGRENGEDLQDLGMHLARVSSSSLFSFKFSSNARLGWC